MYDREDDGDGDGDLYIMSTQSLYSDIYIYACDDDGDGETDDNDSSFDLARV